MAERLLVPRWLVSMSVASPTPLSCSPTSPHRHSSLAPRAPHPRCWRRPGQHSSRHCCCCATDQAPQCCWDSGVGRGRTALGSRTDLVTQLV